MGEQRMDARTYIRCAGETVDQHPRVADVQARDDALEACEAPVFARERGRVVCRQRVVDVRPRGDD